METPSRRRTRSQTGVAPLPVNPTARSTKKEVLRRPFADLTNDSPISGLMPVKMAASSACVYESTPRSKLRASDRPIGEDLLRMQVTALLRKVEAESSMVKKPISCIAQFYDSPVRLAAPTPANTPANGSLPHPDDIAKQTKKVLAPVLIASPVSNVVPSTNRESAAAEFTTTADDLATIDEASTMYPSRIHDDHFHQTITAVQLKCQSDLIQNIELQSTTRALTFETPRKRGDEVVTESDISVASYAAQYDTAEDDDSWSVIVNFNSPGKMEAIDSHPESVFCTTGDTESRVALDDVRDCQEVGTGVAALLEFGDTSAYQKHETWEGYDGSYYTEGNGEYVHSSFDEACDELCQGISNINMGDIASNNLPEFEGKHIRFVYDNDGEMEQAIIVDIPNKMFSSPRQKTKLKGWATPRGKHLRFDDDAED